MRTVEEYLGSLRDGRDVRYRGQHVGDLAAHAALGVCVRHAASAYGGPPTGVAPDDWEVEQDAQRISAFYAIPRSTGDLLRRARVIEGLTAAQWAQFNIIKTVGSDILFALISLRGDLEAALPGAGAAIDALVARCQLGDIATAAAVTDPKGDRSLRPGRQRGSASYLRVVERHADGIVVSGAKLHTTSAPVVDELLILPTRAMMPGEEDYAVSFAVPTSAPGLRMICRPVRENLDPFDNPVSSRAFEIETTTIFDNVFVPWDRVFLAGDTGLAGPLARTFATFHRFTGLSYKPPLAELLLSTVSWIVGDNGLAAKPALRARLAGFVNYVALVRAARTASAVQARAGSGATGQGSALMPDPVLTNAGKHYFASNFHHLAALCHELAGGLIVTAPSVADLADPGSREWLAEVFRGANDDGLRRIAAFNIIRDLTAGELGGYNYVAAIHGEGSLNAQLLSVLEEYDPGPADRLRDALLDDVLADPRLAARPGGLAAVAGSAEVRP